MEDAARENGCLRVVPGSHLTGEIAGHVRDGRSYGSWTVVDEATTFDLAVPGGTVVFFSSNLLHGAYDNTSDRSRYSTAWHYIPGDVNPPKFKRGVYADRHSVRFRSRVENNGQARIDHQRSEQARTGFRPGRSPETRMLAGGRL